MARATAGLTPSSSPSTLTQTLTLTPSSSSSSLQQQRQEETLVLKLKPMKKKVAWKEGTVDNEFLNRKSSKKCCIFHKEKPFDEDDSDDEDVNRNHYCDHDHGEGFNGDGARSKFVPQGCSSFHGSKDGWKRCSLQAYLNEKIDPRESWQRFVNTGTSSSYAHKEDTVSFCKRRGGSNKRSLSYNEWLKTVQLSLM